MNPATVIGSYLFYAALAGLLGALAMTAVMKLIVQTRFAHGDMVTAVGSLLTKSRETARPVGWILHGISAIGFGLLYTLFMIQFELNGWPNAFFTGVGFGIVHGIVVSLSLCWVVADQHPLEEFRQAGVPVALTHFFGHIAYGAVVGLVIGLAPV